VPDRPKLQTYRLCQTDIVTDWSYKPTTCARQTLWQTKATTCARQTEATNLPLVPDRHCDRLKLQTYHLCQTDIVTYWSYKTTTCARQTLRQTEATNLPLVPDRHCDRLKLQTYHLCQTDFFPYCKTRYIHEQKNKTRFFQSSCHFWTSIRTTWLLNLHKNYLASEPP